jgi:hypothetical protein
MSSESVKTLLQKEAEQLARLFNVVFNSAMMYGGSHPTTLKSMGPFYDMLVKSLDKTGMLSLVIDRESLFLDEWPLDKVINTRRIHVQFGKSGILSLTFEHGVSMQEIEVLFRYTGDANVVTSAARIEEMLQQAGSTSIKLNYIRYGRITNDQAVVGKHETGVIPPGGSNLSSSISTESLGKLEEILSLAKLFEHPEMSAAVFTQSALDPSTTEDAVKSISNLRESINDIEGPSADMLLNAVYELKADLADAIAVQKETGKLFAKTEPLNNEMDKLTCDVIVKLVREEFGTGDVSVRRLAQIILRMLPDTNELKRLLPKLKPALLGAGMSLSEYLELIRSLNVEFESESLAGTLSKAASGIGASVSELVSAIQAQPDEAARLLVMAAEIGKGVQCDETKLSSMLTDYIEKVSTGLALHSGELSKDSGTAVLRQVLEKLENGLLDELKNYGVEDAVLSKVASLLTERRDMTFDSATQQWIDTELASKQHLSPQEVSDQLMRMITGQAQLERLHQPLTTALAARGFDNEQMEAILSRIASRIASGTIVKLPPGALAPNNMNFLLDREIKRRLRYHSTFSIIVITVEGMMHNGAVRRLAGEETGMVTMKICSLIKHEIRDIDVIGNLGGAMERALFIIMTMTNEFGAKAALARINGKIALFQLPLKNDTATVITAASVTVPAADVKYDLKSYVELCRVNHHSAVDECLKMHRLNG